MEIIKKYWVVLALVIIFAIATICLLAINRQQIPPKSIFVLEARR